MRNLSRIVFLGFIAFCVSCTDRDIVSENKFELKNKPFESLNYQRAFPDDFIDVSSYNKASKKVKQSLVDKSNDFPWTIEGPGNIGGRLNCIAVHPTDDDIILVGTSAGGVVRTINGGQSWEYIGNDFDFLAIGSIVFDPQNPEIIYVGTGDPNISGLPHPGNGVYKSIDGGESFEHMGLVEECIISQIIVNPENSQIVFAAAMGLPFEGNESRGLYKSIDGGENWSQVLFVSEQAGIIDLIIDPQNPEILYACSWNRIRNNSESIIYGEDAHMYKSIDSGDSWSIVDNGLPQGAKGRMGLAISSQNSDKLYCSVIGIDSQLQGIYKTEDGGANWNEIEIFEESIWTSQGGFGWYFGQIRVNPYDDEEITLLGVDMYTSSDGGESWFLSVPIWFLYEVHADKHDMIYLDESTVLLATDGGLYKTEDHFENWEDIENIENTQFYRIAVNPHNPGNYTGGAQDNGTTTGSSQSPNDWTRDYGGDGFQALFDPEVENLMYAETQNGNILYNDGFWQNFTSGIDPEDRTNWDTPLIMSKHNHEVMYTGTFRVYKNDFAPYSDWYSISEDLTNGPVEEGAPKNSISTVAESGVNPELLYAGTTDGNVWRLLEESGNWELIVNGLPSRYVTNIKTSDFSEGTVLVTHSGYKDNDNVSHIHKSIDYGETWIDVSGDLPEQPINHIEMYNDSVFCIASDFGVYVSLNNGDNWERVGNNMPLIPVFDIELDTAQGVLVAGTFARSIWTFPLDSAIQILPTDTVVNDSTVAVLNMSKVQGVNVFPNPTNDYVKIKNITEKINYTIYESGGAFISKGICRNSSDKINMAHLKSGLYYISLHFSDGTFKLIRVVKN